MRRLFITRAGIAWGAFAIFLLALFASQVFRAPLTATDRAALAAQYASPAFSDARLREIAETADPDAQALIKAELARRGARE